MKIEEAKMKNGTGKKLSEKLSAVLDRMDEVNLSYEKINEVIDTEYLKIQQMLNPDNEIEVQKELDHHFCDFLKSKISQYQN